MRKQNPGNILLLTAVLIIASACNASNDKTTAEMAEPGKTTSGQTSPGETNSGQAKANEPVADDTSTNAKCKIKPPKQPIPCTMEYDPVCGCDGKTYGNACAARGAGVPEYTPGECQRDPVD